MEVTEKIIAENVGTIANSISIKETQHVALRDIIFNEKEEQQLNFGKVNVSSYSSDSYVAPNFSFLLEQNILDHRISILSGGQGFDKSSFVRHIAENIKQKEDNNYVVKELQTNFENISIYKDLRQGKEEIIYILENLHPTHIDYDLQKFIELVYNKNLILLITTDVSIDTWDLTPSAKNNYAFNIPTKNLYDIQSLVSHLKKNILNKKNALKKVLPVTLESSVNGNILGRSYNSLSEEFATPENISLFISLLSKENEIITEERFVEIIKEVKDVSQSLVTKWFRTLDSKQKLIVLGMSLFEGMYDDQFFAVMQDIVRSFWKNSNHSLLSLDYIDLEFTLDYFHLEQIDQEKQVVRNKFSNQRTDIIKAAWYTHRRHILSIMPVLVKTVNQSVNSKASNWEKYGTRQRQMKIRSSISQTIGDIGLVSIPAVENIMVELASQDNETLQRVTAKALARWREFDKDDQLFSLLSDWLSNERVERLLNEFLSKRSTETNLKIDDSAASYLKETVVLTLRYAANYDSPNHLDTNIIQLMKLIISDDDQKAKASIEKVLPNIIHHNILQLKDLILEELIKYDGFAEIVAEGILKGYEDYPLDIKNTLLQWLENCKESTSLDNQRMKFTYRDKVLITVLETFQKIEFGEDERYPITLIEVYEWLLFFHETEGRTAVKQSIYDTLGRIISLDWDQTTKYLPDFFNVKNMHEIRYIVKKFTQIYLNQRLFLKGAKYQIIINNLKYPIWISQDDRPLTEIETIMLTWFADRLPILKQISTWSLLEFAKIFEEEEYAIIQENLPLLLAPPKKQTPQPKTVYVPPRIPKVAKPKSPISWWIKLLMFFMLYKETKEDKATLISTLKFFYKEKNNYERFHFKMLLSKWKKSPDTLTRKLAIWINRLFLR